MRTKSAAYPAILPATAWLIASLVIVVPILWSNYLPLVDLPAHMARQFISLHGDGPLAAFYEYSFDFVPNSAVDMLRLVIRGGDIFTFTQLTMASSAVLMVSSSMIFARVLRGEWLCWPAAAALLFYNAAFYWGFQNFVVTIPVALLAFALWLGIENRPSWVRAVVFVPVAGLVMQMHLFGFLGLALMVAGYEIQIFLGSWRERGGRALRDCIVLALPFLLFSGLELHAILTAPPNPNGGKTAFSELGTQLTVFFRMLSAPQVASEPLLESAAELTFGAIVAVAILGVFGRALPKPVLDPRLKGAVLSLLLGSLAMPPVLSGVYYSDIRLPLLLLLLGVAGTSWQGLDGRKAWLGRLGAAPIVGLLGLQALAYHRFATAYSEDVTNLTRIAEDVPEKARVVSVRGGSLQDAADPTLWHIDALLVPLAKAYVPSLFLGVHNFKVLPKWKAASAPQTLVMPELFLSPCSDIPELKRPLYLRDWRHKYTHLLLADPLEAPAVWSRGLEPVSEAGRFTLFEISGDAGEAVDDCG